jgi:hypothetical protein
MPSNAHTRGAVANGAQRILVASTAMLAFISSFISFWQAAVVVLNDMGSSAFYAGAIAEHFVGRTAPWFILAIMLLSYAVRSGMPNLISDAAVDLTIPLRSKRLTQTHASA